MIVEKLGAMRRESGAREAPFSDARRASEPANGGSAAEEEGRRAAARLKPVTDPAHAGLQWRNNWADAGNETPEAAVKTLLWAASEGNTERMLDLFVIDEPGIDYGLLEAADIEVEKEHIHSVEVMGVRGGEERVLQVVVTTKDGAKLVGTVDDLRPNSPSPAPAKLDCFAGYELLASEFTHADRAKARIVEIGTDGMRENNEMNLRQFGSGWRVVASSFSLNVE